MQAHFEHGERANESYPVSPMQSGMLFNALLHGTGGIAAAYDIEQLHLQLDQAIDARTLMNAWSSILALHPALTASFSWLGSASPSQRVNLGVRVPLEVHDWTHLDACSREQRREAFLAQDRARGFDLAKAPLLRLNLFRIGPDSTELVWTFHHVLLDGHSLVLVLTQLFEVYESLLTGGRSPVRTPARSFREFTESLDGGEIGPALAHFRDVLRGKATPTPLPYSEAQAAPPHGRFYSDLCLDLEPSAANRFHELARRLHLGFGHIARAAWAVVLARHTGDADVVFGVARRGRRSALGGAAEDVVGLFMNVLPVRIRVSETATVREFLRSIREASLAVQPFEHAPLSEAQRQSEIPRGTPLLQTLLVYEEELNHALQRRGGAAWLRRRATLHEQPSFPLNVKVGNSRESLKLQMIFDTRRLRRENVERLLKALSFTLEDLSSDEDRPLRELTAIPPAELRRIVCEWNDTERPFPEQSLIHQLFEQRALAQPEAIALECRDQKVSYRELDQRANQLAHLLQARGVAPGTCVGVCLRRGPNLVLAILAVCKAGAVYLPLDDHYADERLRFMVEDAGAELVIGDRKPSARFAVPELTLDDLEPELRRHSVAPPARSTDPTSPCYVIFTSGSSGVPKGVVLSHRAVVNTLDWVNRTFEVSASDRALFVTSPSFDLSVYDIFGILGAGATLVIADDDLLNDVEGLAASLRTKRITIWNSAPAALQRVLPFVPSDPTPPYEDSRCCELRLLLSSGDWLPLRMIPAIRKAFPKARLVNLGGATEAAIWSNFYPVDSVDPTWRSVPYGRPLQNCRYYVLDAGLRPAPVGVASELYIGGACVALGYLDRPELTAERFIPDPFSHSGQDRLYRTFDLARWKADGNLELLGRLDSQVKVRGFRVELGEVEAALNRLPQVRAGVCTTFRDGSENSSLIAYVVPLADSKLREEDIKRPLASMLPDFMVPSRVVFVTELPVSSNGKLDRGALRPPPPDAPGDRFVPPSTDTERWLAEIWQRFLQRPRIGVDDDFFSLGGHSLIAVELFNEVNSRCGARLPLATLFEYPTVRQLAARIEAAACDGAAPWSTLVRIQPHGSLTPFFCIAGLGGDVMEMRTLALALGPNQPFLGLQYRGVDGQREPHRDIRGMAREFLRDIRQRQPEGPYYIGGFSAGGVPAFEVAQMLTAQGETVALLALIDSLSPTLASWSLADRISLYGQRLRDGGLVLLSDRIKSRIELVSTGIAHRVRALLEAESSFELRHALVKKAFATALRDYIPTRYGGSVLLIRSNPEFRPGIGNGHHPDPENGWRALIDELTVVLLHCDHNDLLESHVESTARTLRTAITSARASQSSSPLPSAVTARAMP